METRRRLAGCRRLLSQIGDGNLRYAWSLVPPVRTERRDPRGFLYILIRDQDRSRQEEESGEIIRGVKETILLG